MLSAVRVRRVCGSRTAEIGDAVPIEVAPLPVIVRFWLDQHFGRPADLARDVAG